MTVHSKNVVVLRCQYDHKSKSKGVNIADKVGLKNFLRSFKNCYTGQSHFKALKSIKFTIRNIYKSKFAQSKREKTRQAFADLI